MVKNINQDIFPGPGWMPRMFLPRYPVSYTFVQWGLFQLLAFLSCPCLVQDSHWSAVLGTGPHCVGADVCLWIRGPPEEIRSTLAYRNTAQSWWTARRLISTGDEQLVCR